MSEHTVKCWPNYFDAIERGDKTFDVRRDDRGYQRGDTLILRRFDPATQTYSIAPGAGRFSIKETRRTITYVLTGGQFGINPGYVVLALAVQGDVVTAGDRGAS